MAAALNLDSGRGLEAGRGAGGMGSGGSAAVGSELASRPGLGPEQVGLGAGESENEAQLTLVPVAELPEELESEPLPFRRAIGRMPVEVDVVVPVREFRVRDVLALAPGQVIESQWTPGGDVPLAAGAVRLAWTEFEVIEDQLAVRVTRLP